MSVKNYYENLMVNKIKIKLAEQGVDVKGNEESNSNKPAITQEGFDQFFSFRWWIFFVWMSGLFLFLNSCVWVIEVLTDSPHSGFIDNILTFGMALPLSFALAAGIFSLVELKRLYRVNKISLNVLTSYTRERR